MTLPGYFWDRWPYFAGKLSWDITTTQVNSALHSSGVANSSTSFGWGKGGKVTSAGVPGGSLGVTLCDLIWHVISRSGVVISITNCYIRLTLLTYNWTRPLTLRLVRRGHWGVRRRQRIPQLAHSLWRNIPRLDTPPASWWKEPASGCY